MAAEIEDLQQKISRLKGLLGSVNNNLNDIRDTLEFVDGGTNPVINRLSLVIAAINAELYGSGDGPMGGNE